MRAFEYASPTSVADAVKALAGSDDSAVLAGGTDLIDRMKDDVASPQRVVDVRRIKELLGIAREGDGLKIGAATRLSDLVKNDDVSSRYPALRQAALDVGSPQIRNMATLGGNLLQRPRCWYFRNGFGLLGGTKTDATHLVRQLEGEFAPINVEAGQHIVRAGDNRYGAIFMTDGDALFVNTSSLAPPLIALGARATLVGPSGERTVDVAELYRVPKAAGDLELALKPGEILTSVSIPAAKGKNASYEVRQKQAHDWPLVLCSVSLGLDGNTASNPRIVLGSVAPIPLRSEAAEKAIAGKAISPETAEAAGAAAVADAKPLAMNAYKVVLTKVAVKRALLAAAGSRYWEA
jgi:xanthine dehydrogenase YagS FAD-binding subunit